MLAKIIIAAVIAFLVVLCIIYFKEIKQYLKSKFVKQKPKQKETKQKETKKVMPTMEEFKPIVSNYGEERDSSLAGLFSEEKNSSVEKLFGEEEFAYEEPNNIDFEQKANLNKTQDYSNFSFDDEFAKYNEIFGSKSNKSKKTINQQIKELPPEIKALLIDDVLKKRDDV